MENSKILLQRSMKALIQAGVPDDDWSVGGGTVLAYQEQSQFISLTYPEGKVDFIVAAQLTEFKPQKAEFFCQEVYLEDPVEIIVKKYSIVENLY